jgi:AmmeMemoRadiSam system protein A
VSLSREQGAALAAWARASLGQALGGELALRPHGHFCDENGASFVTLRWADGGELQGCIGTLEAHRPLADDVAHNALAAGLQDPRGAALSLSDVRELDVELSVLSPLEPMGVMTEDEALRAIRPGVDGIVLHMAGRRATFLPSMWPALPTAEVFLRALKEKAGLPADAWAPGTRLDRYVVEKFVDPAPARAGAS